MAIVGFIGYCVVLNVKAGFGMLGTEMWASFSKYGLTVIPLFIFMGQVAFYSGVNAKLYNAAYKWVGHIRGGLAMATVASCAAFAAICGSNAATAATMTTIALPEMKKYKYGDALSTGSIACGSTLGVVIPPSVVLIVIGLYTGQSIGKLFYGGLVVGLILAFFLALTVYAVCLLYPKWGPVGPKFGFGEKIRALPGATEIVVLFFLVMLGLYFGVFTPAEAGATGSFFALVIGLAQRELSWQGFLNAILDTLSVSCMVIMIVAGATIFGKFLAVTRIPFDLADWVAGLPFPNYVIMAIIFGLFLIGGAVMDALALLILTIPIFFPIAEMLGYDLIWFGVVSTVLVTIGAVTPPVGATAFVVGGMAKDIPLSRVFRGVGIFMPAYILILILMLVFPGLVTYLPSLVK